MHVNRVISVLVISGLLMPLHLPPYSISEALAEESNNLPKDPAAVMNLAGQPTAVATAGQQAAQSVVAGQNMLLALAGTVTPPEPPAAPPPPAEGTSPVTPVIFDPEGGFTPDYSVPTEPIIQLGESDPPAPVPPPPTEPEDLIDLLPDDEIDTEELDDAPPFVILIDPNTGNVTITPYPLTPPPPPFPTIQEILGVNTNPPPTPTLADILGISTMMNPPAPLPPVGTPVVMTMPEDMDLPIASEE